MNKGKSKKKMNSYLKMVLIMLAGGVVGGIFGFVTSYSGENSIAVIGLYVIIQCCWNVSAVRSVL